MKTSHLAGIAITLLFPIFSLAQGAAAAPTSAPSAGCPNFTSVDEFVFCQVMSVLDKEQVGQNGKGSDRQKESPSTDPRSTALVDQSSATDFVSVAASLIPVGPDLGQSQSGSTQSSGQSGTGSGTATASVYALLAGFNHTSPTDPTFYRDHVNSRRVTFTVGTAASTQAEDNTTTPATVYGAKVLLLNSRELYTTDNLKRIREVQSKLSAETAAAARLTPRIEQIMCADIRSDCKTVGGLPQQGLVVINSGTGYKAGDALTVSGGTGGIITVLSVDNAAHGAIVKAVTTSTGKGYSTEVVLTTVGGSGTGAAIQVPSLGSIDQQVFSTFQRTQLTSSTIVSTVRSLSPSAQTEIASLAEAEMSAFSNLQTTLNDTYDSISKAGQMSIAATADQRTGQGNNNYRAELIYDTGVSNRINWTLNGSFEYTDRNKARDSRGGRLATSLQGNLTDPKGAWSKAPITLSFSGEGDWLTAQRPQYSFDAKISVPVTAGFTLPIEYRYANRAAQINSSDSQLRLGLTFDLARLAQAIK